MSTTKFSNAIKAFNTMYGLPAPTKPMIDITLFDTYIELVQRIGNFKNILLEELDEVHELQASISRGASELEILTELADWLGDVQIYCASEMAKFGLDNDEVLDIIMRSNMSKLGPDGKPIKDSRGKILKGEAYWKPEPQIAEYIKRAWKE